MVLEALPHCNIEVLKNVKKSKISQVFGQEGSGTRRWTLELLPPRSRVIWISAKWKLYAPLLWQEAEKKKCQIFGVECPDRQRWRTLWRELFESKAFDVWVLDHLYLKNSEGLFLRRLLQRSAIQAFILDDRPHIFCDKRLRLQRQHDSFMAEWQKSDHGLMQLPAHYLRMTREELCLH